MTKKMTKDEATAAYNAMSSTARHAVDVESVRLLNVTKWSEDAIFIRAVRKVLSKQIVKRVL
jgi:hypothetical protein